MLRPLDICAIVGLIVAAIIAIIVWTIVGIEYTRLLKQRRIDRIIERIRQRAEDSGNESDGDTEELSTLIELGDYDLGDVNNL
uniref:Protein Vpu n=1 Tax=Human immunodeficiency virus type 1 TaxID=11676 RepID=A0A0M4ANX3_HV1|nr:vpu protein [Human immunodeficiency virus 1]